MVLRSIAIPLTAVRRSGVPVRGGVETGVTAQECSCRCVFRRLSQWCSRCSRVSCLNTRAWCVLSGLVLVVVGVVVSCARVTCGGDADGAQLNELLALLIFTLRRNSVAASASGLRRASAWGTAQARPQPHHDRPHTHAAHGHICLTQLRASSTLRFIAGILFARTSPRVGTDPAWP